MNNRFQPHERGVAVGCYNAGLRLGIAATPVLMVWLIAHWGWRVAFYATGCGSLAWVALWCFTYAETASDPLVGNSESAQIEIVLTFER